MKSSFFGADLKPYKVVCRYCGFKKIIYPQSTCCMGFSESLYRTCPHCKIPTERKKLGILEGFLDSLRAPNPRIKIVNEKNMTKEPR